MKTFHVRNVSEALFVVSKDIAVFGDKVQTRNGSAYEYSEPVATVYAKPRERVLFYPERDANPFFHCLESLWMLGGRNDVAFVTRFSGNIKKYSDDGKTFHGAYGHRWRKWFGYDQLNIIAHRLTTYPNDRRAVLTMWDANTDLLLGNDAVDLPCNTQVMFNVRDEHLNMTVINRSNDMVWGAYGANAVHMSFLQEYMALRIGKLVGHYTQFSNNLHAYVETYEKIKKLKPDYDPYLDFRDQQIVPLITPGTNAMSFDHELDVWLEGGPAREQQFLTHVATPMRESWEMYKRGDKLGAFYMAEQIVSPDWRKACVEWLDRRKK